MEGFGNSAVTAGAPHASFCRLLRFLAPFFRTPLFALAAFPTMRSRTTGFRMTMTSAPRIRHRFLRTRFPRPCLPTVLSTRVSLTTAFLTTGPPAYTWPSPSASAATPGSFLPAADLTADNAGLIDQSPRLRERQVLGRRATGAAFCGLRGPAPAGTQADRPATLSGRGPGQGPHQGTRPGRGRTDRAGPGRVPAPRRAAARHSQGPGTQMPHALAALDTGQLNEERAMYVAKETACLSARTGPPSMRSSPPTPAPSPAPGPGPSSPPSGPPPPGGTPAPLPSAPATPPRSGG
jgi:hypothetical protein